MSWVRVIRNGFFLRNTGLEVGAVGRMQGKWMHVMKVMT